MTSKKKAAKTSAAISRKRGVREFLVYVIPFGLLIFLSFAEQAPSTPGDSSGGDSSNPFSSDFWYKRALSRPDHPNNVTVIVVGREMPATIGAAADGKNDLKDACKRRIYIAELLKAVAVVEPKVVVVDQWLDPASCQDAASTDLLRKEVADFSTRTPIVFGLGSYNPNEIKASFPAEFIRMKAQRPPLEDTQLVLMPSLDPGIPGSHIAQGVAEVNSDNRKIPLSWPMFSQFNSEVPGEPKRMDSLSIAAVRAFDPGHPVLARVGALAGDGSPVPSPEAHPFTSFLKEEDFPVYSAIEVICTQATDKRANPLCANFQQGHKDLKLNGRVLVVGVAGTGADIHQTIIGRVPGLMLQANYIQSLLDLRVYKPIKPAYQIAMGAIWLLAILWISWRFASQPLLSLVCSLLATAIPVYLIHSLISRFGYYTQLLIPLMIAALVLSFTRQIERMVSRQEESS